MSDLFLVVTNNNDDTTKSVDSVIYKWEENQFNRFQGIRTEEATASTSLALKTEFFLVFANRRSDKQGSSVQSSVYKWSGDHFVKLQSLQTYRALGVNSFSNNGETLVAFANWQEGNSANIDSYN